MAGGRFGSAALPGVPDSLTAWLAASVDERRAALATVREHAAATAVSHGAYITLLPEPEDSTGGELAGVPFTVKDNIDVAGVATTAGSPLLRGAVATVDAGAVAPLREAGAVVVGKTNMHELAFGITSDNPTFGPVRNPFDPDRVAGGSSGGSAVSVALGTVPFALGTDTGGSVTIPASFCAIVGFRPTTGRYPGDGLVGLSWTRDTVGLHARSVADVRHVDQVITRTGTAPAPAAAPVIGVPRARYADLDLEVAAVAAAALDRLARAGIRLVDVDTPGGDAGDPTLGDGPGLELLFFEAERLLPARAAGVPGLPPAPRFADLVAHIATPDVHGVAEAIAAVPLDAAAYTRARAVRSRLRRSHAELYDRTGVDAVLAPTSPVPPPPVGSAATLRLNGRDVPLFATVTRNTEPATVVGAPMLTVPAGRTAAGLPVGMGLEGRIGGDEALLVLGELLEPILGG